MNFDQLTAKSNRAETFRLLIDNLKLKRAVEVGILQGFFSDTLIGCGLEHLTGIDIEKLSCIANLENHHKQKFSCLVKDSLGASLDFTDESLCLVYLDDDHTYKYVSQELEAWWPKVRVGGILAGHDFIEYDHHELGSYGVVQAVVEFCVKHSLKFHINGCGSDSIQAKLEVANERGFHQKQVELGLRKDHNEVPNFYIVKT